jgi:hypothetical protein
MGFRNSGRDGNAHNNALLLICDVSPRSPIGWANWPVSTRNGYTSFGRCAALKSISNMPMAWIQDFSPQNPRTVLFTSGDDLEAKQKVMELIDSVGFAAVDLGSLAVGGAMHQVGGSLSGLELHFVRRVRL